MKKFKFKLETVLNVKERKEEKLKHELLKLHSLRQEQEILLNETKEKRTYITNEKSERSSGSTDIQSLLFYEQYLTRLLRQIDLTKEKIRELEGLADKKRLEVVEASREKKVFEKLKDKQFEVFNKMVLYNEQLVLDEMAVSKFNRKEQHNY
jgi:flagellar FliJ protein